MESKIVWLFLFVAAYWTYFIVMSIKGARRKNSEKSFLGQKKFERG